MTKSQSGDIFKPGDLLNNTYRIEAILGRGGTSEVYKARSEISGRVMAVKALRAEYATNEDFLVLMTREEDIRDVRHDAIVRYFDTQKMPDGVVYLVMDHVDGPGLDVKLRDGGMRAGDLLVVARRVCEGLIAAHARNIVHRDLSPDNIILRNDNPGDAVIIDFGIAKDTNPGAETIVGNEFAGKYAYAAPEQLSGRTDPRSDIYSLGALLLATFRGKKPNIGDNPMEVVQNKSKKLDLEGVPQPLSGLIARMTDPDPDKRFQSATECLAALNDPDGVTPSADISALDDATVIVPAASRGGTPKTDDRAKPKPTRDGKRKLLVPMLAVLFLAIAGGAGAYLTGLFGPRFPVADPYQMLVERGQNGFVRAAGSVPSPETQEALTSRMEELGGEAELTLASGNISEGWGPGLIEIVAAAEQLDEFRIAVNGDEVVLSGLASSRMEKEAVESLFSAGFPAGFIGRTEIALGPRFIRPDDIEPFLGVFADCGSLRLLSPPPLGYGLDDPIVVVGRFASEDSRSGLESAIEDVSGTRPVRVEGEILNPALCQIDSALPQARVGGFDVRMGYGDRPEENTSGRYVVGENPVIDVRLPENVTTGYLSVSVIDVKNIVFHLLPNRNRPDNSIATLREEASPEGFVRIAYGIEEASENGRLAFTVDDSVLGISKIIVIHSEQPLFDQMRPTSESAAAFTDALIEARGHGDLAIRSLDSAMLTTEIRP